MRAEGRIWPALLVITLAWWNCGTEHYRQEKAQLHSAGDAWAHRDRFLGSPWGVLVAWVSEYGDEQLYYEYTRAILGEDPDVRHIAAKHDGDVEVNALRLKEQLARRSGVRLPYRDFDFEYPPGVLPFILLPRVVASTLAGYRVVYGIEVVLFYLGAWLLAARLLGARRTPVWRRALVATLALGPILTQRLDVFPAFFTVAALAAAEGERDRWAGALLFLGGACKLYPLLLWPVWCARLDRRRAVQLSIGVGGAALAVGVLVWIGVGGASLQWLRFLSARPIQVESLVGSLLLAVGAPVAFSFGSFNVVAPGWLAAATGALSWIALAGVTFAAFRTRSGRPDLLRWTSLSLVTVLITAKVLSPQYVIWLVPLLALFDTATFSALVAVLLTTQLVFPTLYGLVLAEHPVGVAALVVRNALLVLLAVLVARGARVRAISGA